MQPSQVGDIVFKLNQASRFEMHGIQLESDFYPGLGKIGYLFFNLGISPGETYPFFRSSMELYFTFPWHMEISGGVSYLRYDDNIMIYSASIGGYLGPLFLQVKGFLSPKEKNYDQTIAGKAKIYFNRNSQFDILEIQGDINRSPRESSNNISDNTGIQYDQSSQGTIDFQKKCGRMLLLGGSVGYA